MKIRRKLSFAFLLIALTPLCVLSLLNYKHLRLTLEERANQGLLAEARILAENLDGFITANLDIIRSEAQIPIFGEFLDIPPEDRGPNTAIYREVVAHLVAFGRKNQLYLRSYALLDRSGKSAANTTVATVSGHESHWAHFSTPMRDRLPHVSIRFTPGLRRDEDGLFFSAAVFNANRKVVGILRAQYKVAILQNAIAADTRQAPAGIIVTLLDEHHIYLTHSTKPERMFKSVVPLGPDRVEELQRIGRLPRRPIAELATNLPDFERGLNSVNTQTFFTFQDEVAYRYVAAVVPLEVQPWLLVFAKPYDTFLGPINVQIHQTLLIVLIAIGVVVMGTYILSRYLAAPIVHLTMVANKLASGDLTSRSRISTRDEIGDLSLSFDEMAERIQKTLKGLEQEIAERKRMGEELLIAKERVQVTMDSIGDAVMTTDAYGQVEYLNPVAEKLTGWSLEEARGHSLHSVFHIINEETRKPVLDPVARCISNGKIIGLANHTVLISRSGREYAIQDSAAPILGKNGEILGVVLVFNDVTEARHLALQATHQAAHDALTGLVNRREFEVRLEEALRSAKDRGIEHSLCYLDLDQFKIVNDTAGHVAGDELLKQVTEMLKAKVRSRDTLARIGGDEFSLILEYCPLDKAHQIAESLVTILQNFSFSWEGRIFRIGVSIGVVSINSESDSTSKLLSQADVACYTAKDLGRNRVYVYQPEDSEVKRRHTEIHRVAELREALENKRFRLYCQPIFKISQANRGMPTDYEILLRLLDPEGTLSLPGTFIPAAERYGLMPAIDRWVIESSLCWYCKLHTDFQLETGFAINLSGSSLNDASLFDFVQAKLNEYSIPPERICLEITETAAINHLSEARSFIRELKQSGCRFALDDFGSGFSSFNYLKHLPVDYLKIDGCFVRDIVNDPINHAMVTAINEVAHTMNIRTVAEWAESPAIVTQLRELGVDYVQGYAVGAPVALEEIKRVG